MNEEYKPITNLWKDSEGYRYFGTLKLSSKIKYDGDDFIPLWEWFKQLQQENKQFQERIEYLERSNDRREDTIIEQRQEISDLEDNLGRLKEWVKDQPICNYKNDDDVCNRKTTKIDNLIPKHLPNEFIQQIDKCITHQDIKCIAHKVNEVINYLQHINKEE